MIDLRSMTQYALGLPAGRKETWPAQFRQSTEARQASAKAGSVILHLLAETASGNLLLVQGHLRQAADTYREVIRKVGERTFHPRIEASLQLGDLYREWNELEPAEHLLREGIQLAEITGWEPYLAQGLLSLARVITARERGRSQGGQVEDLLNRAAEIGRRLGRQGVMIRLACCGRGGVLPAAACRSGAVGRGARVLAR
jgi:ATP/maltotriose-dependent transcriptional regulator MalT